METETQTSSQGKQEFFCPTPSHYKRNKTAISTNEMDGNKKWRTRYRVVDVDAGIVYEKGERSHAYSIDTSSSGKHSTENSRKLPSIKSIGDIHLTKTLGSGSTGKVKLGINSKTGEKVAVKIVYRTVTDRKAKESKEAKEKRIMREAALLNLLKHPNIVQLYDILVTEDFFFLFFEYVEGGQMLDYIISHGKLKEKQARRFIRQLLSAVDYCHKNSIVHRDLKIENVLIDKDGDVKLIDFGLSNFFNPKDSLKTFCGSLYFAAPELLKGNVYIGPEIDVWSLGIILYVLVCGKVPFDDKSLPILHEKIKKCTLDIPADLTPECRHLLSRMIVAEPVDRASLAEVIHHPWTSSHCETLSPNQNEIQNYILERNPIQHIDSTILESICVEFDYDLGYAQSVLNAAIKDWQSYMRHELVSLYYLTIEKLQRDSTMSTHNRLHKGDQEIIQSQKKEENTSTVTRPRSHSLANSNTILTDAIVGARRQSLRLPDDKKTIEDDRILLDDSKIKTVYLKGIFSVNTTSVKSPALLAAEISKVLAINRIKNKMTDSVFLCEYVPSIDFTRDLISRHENNGHPNSNYNPFIIQFEVHIVKVAILGLFGIQFHRVRGDFKQYKNLCSHILTELHL